MPQRSHKTEAESYLPGPTGAAAAGPASSDPGGAVHNGEYGLGIDIGDGTIAAAVCRRDDATRADAAVLRLGHGSALAPAEVCVAADGSVSLAGASPAGQEGAERLAGRVMARVGTPTPLRVGPQRVTAAEVVAATAACVRAVAEAHEGRRPSVTVLAVPPSWSD